MPTDFWSIPFITETLILLGGLLVIYFIKEWWTNLQYQLPPQNGQTAENPPQVSDYPAPENIPSQTSPVAQPQKKSSTVLFGTKNFRMSTGKNGEKEVILTADLISKISSFGTMNSWMKAIVTKIVPQPALDDLIKLAYEGKLKPGMKVSLKNGYITLHDEENTP